MRRKNHRYKKWQLHTKNQWPTRAVENDPLVQMWWADRHLNAFEWEEQTFIATTEWHKTEQQAKSYIDYLQCSELCAHIDHGWVWFLLNREGRVVHLQASSDMGEKVESLGIRKGFSFAKERIGTTAFSFAQSQQSLVTLYSYETYMKALHNFSSVCMKVSNCQHGYYVLLLLEEEDEETLIHISSQVSKITQRPSSNLRYLSLFEHVIDSLDKMLLVFDANGDVIYKNQLAELQSNNKGLLAAGRQAFTFSELLSVDGKGEFKRHLPDRIVSLSVTIHSTGNERVCFACLTSEPLESDEWKRDVVGEIINKDSFLEKVISQRPKSGLRLLVNAEVGSGERYVVRFIRRKLREKQLYHIDCMAGFNLSTVTTSIKKNFVELLQNANEHILHIENIDHLSADLQAVLLKCLSSGVIEDEQGLFTPIHIDLICSASRKNDWQQPRTSRMLFYMLSANQLDLKPLHNDTERLEQAIHSTLTTIGYREQRLVSIDKAAMGSLLKYRWPGNFLELFQVIENALLVSNDGLITLDLLPDRFIDSDDGIPSMTPVRDAERNVIISAWREHNGKVARVAEALGMSRTTLWRKMKKLDLDSQRLAIEE